MKTIYAFTKMSAQFLHNNLVKFCCARRYFFKLHALKSIDFKGLLIIHFSNKNRPLKEPKGSTFCLFKFKKFKS